MSTRIETAMVLAAGLGTRLRPLTDSRPKPLVAAAGRALIDHVIDRLVAAGVRRVVVNAHYKAEMLEEHLSSRRDVEIRVSRETALLDTGGGVNRTLDLLDRSFYVVNSDIIWLDGKVPLLRRLACAWDPDQLDSLMMLQRTVTALGYDGAGDFFLDPMGLARRRSEREIAPYVYGSVQILHRRLFDDAPVGAFSLNLLWDRAIARGRLRGIVHDGEWYLIDTPAGLAATEERLASHRIER